MKLRQLWQILLVTGSVWLGVAIGATAQPVSSLEGKSKSVSRILRNSPSTQSLPRLSELERPVTSAQMLVQSPAPAPATVPVPEVVQVTGVKANPTDKGVYVILQTTQGEQLQVVNRSAGNSYIADIPNAQLRLPSGDAFVFRSQKPVAGITEITVTNFDANTIRVTVTGEASVPTVELFDSPQEGLIFSVASAATSTPQGQQPPTPPTSQQQPGSETQPSEPSAEGEEEIEIVVTGEQEDTGYSVPDASTATRTDTPLRDIPQSIQVVPQQVLEDQNAVRLRDALRNVSGVFVGNTFGGTTDNFNIRGFADATILRDGFKESFAESGLSLRDLADVQQIEVLKGPASVLYGYVEPGGAINLVTKQPLDDPFYNIDLSIGSYGFYRPSIDFSSPLTPDKALRYRLNLAYQNADSFRDFVESERFFAAPVFGLKLGDRTNLSINTSYLYDRRTLDRGIVAIGKEVADIPIERFLGEPDDFRRIEQFAIGYRFEHEFNDNLKIRNRFQYLQNNESVFNTNATELDEDSGTLYRDYFDNANEYKLYAMQTDLISEFRTGLVNHQLLFGFDLQRNTIKGFFRTPFDAFDTSVEDRQTPSINVFNPIYNVRPPDRSSFIFRRDDLTTTDSLSIFLQDQIALADNVKLLVSGRFDTITQERDDELNDSESSESNDAFSPRVGIVYQPIQPISLYASYSRSFAPNTGIGFDGSLLEPTRGTQYEAGIRAELNPSLAATLAAYEITKTNIATTDPNDPAFTIAVGEQRSRGIEFDLSGEISPGWNIIASYSYTNAEITESEDYPVGNKVPNVPHNKASLWTNGTEIRR